jgi:hypothetical protein
VTSLLPEATPPVTPMMYALMRRFSLSDVGAVESRRACGVQRCLCQDGAGTALQDASIRSRH